MSLIRSLIQQEHRPILDQLLVRLSLRQGHVARQSDDDRFLRLGIDGHRVRGGRRLVPRTRSGVSVAANAADEARAAEAAIARPRIRFGFMSSPLEVVVAG